MSPESRLSQTSPQPHSHFFPSELGFSYFSRRKFPVTDTGTVGLPCVRYVGLAHTSDLFRFFLRDKSVKVVIWLLLLFMSMG
jgi:hypothetical protein